MRGIQSLKLILVGVHRLLGQVRLGAAVSPDDIEDRTITDIKVGYSKA